jgi:APA family basic amino acid/polyamine antiporter
VAEETREPQRNMPIGIIGSLIVCTIIYVVVAAVFTGLISYDALRATSVAEQAEPLTYALEHAAGPAGADSVWLRLSTFVVAIGAVIATTAVLLVFQMGQPRIFFSMARDGLLPSLFAKIHPKWKTPHVTTILTGLFVGLIAGVTSIDEMVNLTNIGTLFAFILVCAGVIILRFRDPDRPRPFRVPGGIVIPILGILSCMYLMYFLPSESWFRFAAWLNLGFVIYIAYGAVRSRLTGREAAPDAAAHDAETAWAGASLGAAGLVLLFIALALDIHARAGRPDAGGAAESLFNPSWFLVVPLILNAVLLFPVTIARARKALAAGVADTDRSRAVAALGISAILLIGCVVYLVVVLPAKL